MKKLLCLLFLMLSMHAMADTPRIVNIINFIREVEPRPFNISTADLYYATEQEAKVMRSHDLRGTWLIQYDALVDTRYQQLLKDEMAPGSEVGGWWEITQPQVEAAGMKWRGRYSWDWYANTGFSVGYTPAERERLVDVYMAKFYEIFGCYPKSVGSWIVDAHTLAYMHERYGASPPASVATRWAPMAIRSSVATGTKPTIPVGGTSTCRRSTVRSRSPFQCSACWAATPSTSMMPVSVAMVRVSIPLRPSATVAATTPRG